MRFLTPRLLAVALLICICWTQTGGQQTFSSEQFTSDFDFMWSGLRDSYAYFDKKETDWNRVRESYRPMLAGVKSRSDFVTLLERVLDELYDNHTSLNTNLHSSPRLVPSGLDIWAEWHGSRAVITELRSGFSAEQAGLKAGMEILSIGGLPVRDAVAQRLPKSIRRSNDEVRNWALRAVLAGTHDNVRVVEARNQKGVAVVYRLDLPSHTTADNYRYLQNVEWKMLSQKIGYIKINDLISQEIVPQFDSALMQLKESRGLILDLRDIARGGNTGVAEPLLGRLIRRRMGYQDVIPRQKAKYTKEVSPRGDWIYKKPVVVLVNHWTASMAEGMAIGLDGMKRATVVGTRMAGLSGGVFNLELPHTKIGVNYPGEKLNHISGAPRENFLPPVLVDLTNRRLRRLRDPIFEVGYRELNKLIKRSPEGSAQLARANVAKETLPQRC